MAGGRDPGGICGLLDLIEEHRDALAYDWRTRFHLPLSAIPDVMDWREAVGHIRILRRDPSSQLVVAVEGMEYALTREGWMLADLIDIQGVKAMGKKWKRYPRPIKPTDVTTKRRGNVGGRTRSQVIEILRTFGHGPPV